MADDRAGATVAEAVVALLVATLLLRLALGALDRAISVHADVRARTEWLAAARSSRLLLGSEARRGDVARDWEVYAPDSVRARAFRGHGRVCSQDVTTGGALPVSYRGMREPDTGKDSVLWLGVSGRWTAGDLVAESRAPEGVCDPASGARSWTVEPPPSEAVALVRVFESVSFHVSGGALRLRSGGGGGRQPLTPEVLGDGSGFAPAQGGGLWIRLRPADRDAIGWVTRLVSGG